MPVLVDEFLDDRTAELAELLETAMQAPTLLVKNKVAHSGGLKPPTRGLVASGLQFLLRLATVFADEVGDFGFLSFNFSLRAFPHDD